jgi:uncharacterized protein
MMIMDEAAVLQKEADAGRSRPAGAPPQFHLLAKPTGAACNLDCQYCFFLSKDALYPNERPRMSDETLETYIRQLLKAHRTCPCGSGRKFKKCHGAQV